MALTRDWFPAEADVAEFDPLKSARKSLKTALPKRFYQQAGIGRRAEGWALLLDGKPARTPGRNILATPAEPAAALLAAEWQAQQVEINPAGMPVTRIVNAALDHVSSQAGEVRQDIAAYAESDLICYFAAEPAQLATRQQAAWRPMLDWAKTEFGADFNVAHSIVPVAQTAETLAAMRAALAGVTDPITLAALHVITTITGSAILALAVLRGRLQTDEAFNISELDADFQRELWGEDDEAAERRANRLAEISAAGSLLAAVRGGTQCR